MNDIVIAPEKTSFCYSLIDTFLVGMLKSSCEDKYSKLCSGAEIIKIILNYHNNYIAPDKALFHYENTPIQIH